MMSKHRQPLWTTQQPRQALLTRRLFLKSSVAGLLIASSRFLFPDSAPGQALPEGQLRFYNVNTKERLEVRYRSRAGEYNQSALDTLNYFLRCPHTNQVCEIDLHLLEQINQIEKQVGKGKEIRVYSAYRSPSYNNLLIRRGHGAAPKSLHTMGKAIDFSIPGIRLSTVRRAAFHLKQGGVGYYRRQGFIHLDTGPIRYW